MAAAAALSRSRGAAGARNTGGLFFIFTLLSLLCLVTSHFNKDELEKLKGKIRKLEKDLDIRKVQMETASKMLNFYTDLMDPLSDLAKKASSELPDGFPPLDGLMHTVKNFMQKTKVYVDDRKEEAAEELESQEEKLREMKKLIQILEEDQAEL